jgi:hypothetical protein
MDVARVIGLRRCTPGFLHRAAVGYLAGEHRVSAADDWCDTAIDTAATELRGAVRALTPVPHTQGTQVASYKLADYLDQHGRKIFAETIPPPEFWAAATQSEPDVQARFGAAAVDRGLLKTAAQLLKNATDADAYAAVRLLGIMQPLHPADTRAAAWAAARADLTRPLDVARLIDTLHKAEMHAQLEALLQRDPAAYMNMSDPGGVSFLIEALHQAGAAAQVSAILARNPAANADTTNGQIIFLLDTLHKFGATEQVATLAERAVASDDATSPSWTAGLLTTLHDIGADDQIAALLALNPAAHADLTESEPVDAIHELFTALHQVAVSRRFRVSVIGLVASLLVSAVLVMVPVAGGWCATTS